MSVYEKYEAVIGLEVHAQLTTNSKAYSSDANDFGALPNSNVSVITLGHPGTLPLFNKKIIEYAVKLGLAVKGNINPYNEFARKNYFYADLPKGYQITQDTTPICTGGKISIKTKESLKEIGLIRIHWEEDAGKSMHDVDPFDTLIDLNRAGVPLLEIVSEPDLRSGEEAYAYLTEVRRLVRYLEICDGNMEEGSLRCDANISVRIKGDEKFGRRVEVKNMNSIRNVQRAIEHEIVRQIDLIEAGQIVSQDTRSFDAVSGTTFSLRSKEMANDYRYFPEPDLQPVLVTENYIHEVKKMMPPLPAELFEKYIQLGLSDYDASVLIDDKYVALYFEELLKHTANKKSAANWVMVNIKSYLNENAIHIQQFGVAPQKIAELIQLIDDNKISNSVASQKILPLLIQFPEKSPLSIAEENNLIQESDSSLILEFAKEVIAKNPQKVAEYKSGKTGLIGLFMGELMKLSKGKADPKVGNSILKQLLDEKTV